LNLTYTCWRETSSRICTTCENLRGLTTQSNFL
jgi:hypothetical protein